MDGQRERVTVADLAEGQLEGDRQAAAHYGYEVSTFQADMRDLGCLDDEAYDLVFQADSMAYVPDIHSVYAEVSRVLKPGGTYRVAQGDPAIFSVEWIEGKYCISVPYRERVKHRDDGGIEYRHQMDDIFNGLIDSGFSVRRVYQEPYSGQGDVDASAGSWNHERAYVAGGFTIVAKKEQRS